MKQLTTLPPLLLILFAALTLRLNPAARADPAPVERHGDLVFKQLADGVWLHTSFMTVGENPRFPVNGVVVVNQNQAIVIDLPVREQDAAALFDWVQAQSWTTRYVVPQHWHQDSTGGLPEAHRRGLSVVMLDETHRLLSGGQAPAQFFGWSLLAVGHMKTR